MSPNSWCIRSQQENYVCGKLQGYLHDSLAARTIPGGVSIDRFPLPSALLMQPWSPPQKGDLNGDNKTTPATLAAADVSGDGIVTSQSYRR